MSNQTQRIKTMIALLESSVISGRTIKNKIKTEFNQAISVNSVSPTKRRNLLKILHTTRALDTSLKTFLEYYSIRNGSHSLGQYLHQLQRHNDARINKMSSSERNRYQNAIANVRNKYMHESDSYPRNDSEIYSLISEMETCLSRVFSL